MVLLSPPQHVGGVLPMILQRDLPVHSKVLNFPIRCTLTLSFQKRLSRIATVTGQSLINIYLQEVEE
jgi:hypothetical protein